MRIPWTVLVATMSSAQAQPDPTIGTGRPMPSIPDTVAVDSLADDGGARPAAASATRFAPTLVTLHGSSDVTYASATDPATGRRASRLVPGTISPRLTAMDPVTTVLEMFDAFARRDVDGWIGAMARDYRFDSDDPDFVAAHPGGFDRDDERAFATHLFRVGARGRDGAPMPWAMKVDAHADPIWAEAGAITAEHAIVTVVRGGIAITRSDATTVRVGGASTNTFELEREDGLWRVREWHESVSGEPDVATSRSTDARPGRRDAPDPNDVANALPARLAIRALVDRERGAPGFELALPGRGGTLELFDVAGRRVARRDLDALAPGVRRVTLEGRGLGAGIFFARVRQRGASASTRVVWYR